jgi:hypothetical protein
MSRELRWGLGERYALRRLSDAYRAVGRLTESVSTLQELSAMSTTAGDAYGVALIACSLGEIELERGEQRAAVVHFVRCLDFIEKHGHPTWREHVLRRLETAVVR